MGDGPGLRGCEGGVVACGEGGKVVDAAEVGGLAGIFERDCYRWREERCVGEGGEDALPG